MRMRSMVMIVGVAVLVGSPLAHGQVPLGNAQAGTRGASGKPSAPTTGTGDRKLIPPAEGAIAPPSDALRNLAGGGYADPNYVPPQERSKKAARHRVNHALRAKAWCRPERYVYPVFPCWYCYYD